MESSTKDSKELLELFQKQHSLHKVMNRFRDLTAFLRLEKLNLSSNLELVSFDFYDVQCHQRGLESPAKSFAAC